MNMLSVHVTKEHARRLQIKVVDAIERAYPGVLSQARVSPSEGASVGLQLFHVPHRLLISSSSDTPETCIRADPDSDPRFQKETIVTKLKARALRPARLLAVVPLACRMTSAQPGHWLWEGL
jgi:hypothetical protein